jgi:hypothetical protein
VRLGRIDILEGRPPEVAEELHTRAGESGASRRRAPGGVRASARSRPGKDGVGLAAGPGENGAGAGRAAAGDTVAMTRVR